MEKIEIIILIGIILLCLVISVVAILLVAKTRGQVMRTIGVVNELHNELKARASLVSQVEATVDELNQTVSSQSVSIEELKLNLQQLSHHVKRLSASDPAIKMYTKAAQMVDAGESVDEIMQACGLPRAEVEVLASMRKT